MAIKARAIREENELTTSCQWLMEQDMFTVQIILSAASTQQHQSTKIEIQVNSKTQGNTTY